MPDQDHTKAQLLEQIATLQQRVMALELTVTQQQQVEVALERQVQAGTEQYQQAIAFDTMLKRITDQVRDSLDESQILQTVVQALGLGLGVDCCDTALYDLDQGFSTICYEYTTLSAPPAQGKVVQLQASFHQVHPQLLQGQCVQFCEHGRNPIRPINSRVAILACPLFDDQGVLGDLWLVRCQPDGFNELEVRLAQQVANQCAIALRQARLYQTAQAQVVELEKLHQLKDDFLNTVSHELRTPMTNIRMATQMLEVSLRQAGLFEAEPSRVTRYFQILQEECQREINLINNLLDLARLDAEVEPLVLTTIQLQVWLPSITKPFLERTRSQQQRLELELAAVLPPLITDRSHLERILQELLQNACKYTPAGATITVTAQTTATLLQLSVSNSGVTLPASELTRIFDKFYRVHNHDPWRHGGTGLGLALVKKLVAQLGGTIRAESVANQVTFTVKLPLQPQPLKPAATAS